MGSHSSRNETSQTYAQDTAEEVCASAKVFLATAQSLPTHMNPQNESGGVPLPDSILLNAVSIGGVSKRQLLQRLSERNILLNHAAEALFEDERFTTLPQSKELQIVYTSAAKLGLPDGALYEQVVAQAHVAGLAECPLELGPHLRLQLLEQSECPAQAPAASKRAPPGSITIASTPLDNTDETPKGFYLRRIDGRLWLRGYWSSPDHVWAPDDILVFARRQ